MGAEIEQLEREQKKAFAQTIHQTIQEENAQFVGEEGEHGVSLIAAVEAQRLGCKHINIEMTPAERAQKGIPHDYTNPSPYTKEQKESWNSEREEHMVQRAISGAGSSESIVILCGRDHSDSLAERFRTLEHDVEISDLNEEEWYVENWLKHIFEH